MSAKKTQGVSTYNYASVQRHEFIHTHNGPEELPYRKKRYPKNKCKKNKGNEHVETKQFWFRALETTYYESVCVYCGKKSYKW